MAPAVNFDGRVAIVTGSGRRYGLGSAYAKMLAGRGAKVVVNDVQDSSEVVDQISSQGGQVVADKHDISTEEGARALVQTAVDAYGRLDMVVNNAGVVPLYPFPDMPWDEFDRTLKVHVYGSYFLTKHAWPHLIDSGSGRVVMISSIAALWGWTPNLSNYGVAKGAVLGLTRQLALEGDPHGIHVNVVFPNALTHVDQNTGPMMFRAREYAEHLEMDPSDLPTLAETSAEKVAAVVAWLCHPDCTSNGEFFNAQAGGVRRVFLSMSTGIHDPRLTVEEVRDRFDQIMDPTDGEVLPAFRGGGLTP